MVVTSPITTFENINAILNILYNNNSFSKEQSLDKQFIANKMNRSVAIVNNALAMLREMKLVSGGVRYIETEVYLLNNGKLFVEILRTNDKEKIQDFSIIIINESNSKLLQESQKLLKKDPQISYDSIGLLIRKKIRFDKIPKSNATYTNIGRTIKDIFCGLQIIDQDEVRLRRKNIRERFTNKLYPHHRISHIFKGVENFRSDNTWQIDIPSQFNLEREYALEMARILIDLNIAYYIDFQNNILKLTNKGVELKKNVNNNRRSDIFRAILLDFNPINEIIKRMIDLDRTMSSVDVGNLISVYNGIEWKYRTKIGYGSALISWLKEADILYDAKEQGRYVITDSFFKEYRNKYPFHKRTISTQKRTDLIQDQMLITKDTIIGNIYKKIFSIKFLKTEDWDTAENQQFFYARLKDLKELYDDSNLNWISEAENLISQAFKYSDKSFITENLAKIITVNLNEDL